jgi:peptidoglycan/xylan/chitin deacetylase (PgdA/CDA1 family)
MYHYVRDAAATPFPGLNALAPRQFAAQVDAIAQARSGITYDQFERAITRREPFDAPAALLTFDDGFVDHYESVFPALRDRGLSGVFFLAGLPLGDPPRVLNVHKTHFLIETLGAAGLAEAVQHSLREQPVAAGAAPARTPDVYRYDARSSDAELKHLLNYELPSGVADAVLGELFAAHIGDEMAFARELYLSAAQIAEMRRAGMTFGFHTESHRVLSRLSPDAQRREVELGVSRVQALTGQSSVPFCYPYGHAHTFDGTTIAALRAAGYATAFTTTRRAVDALNDDPFQLPRYDTRDLPPFTAAVPDA